MMVITLAGEERSAEDDRLLDTLAWARMSLED